MVLLFNMMKMRDPYYIDLFRMQIVTQNRNYRPSWYAHSLSNRTNFDSSISQHDLTDLSRNLGDKNRLLKF